MKIELTESERVHLLSLVWANKEEGSYYGLQSQYLKRTERLLDKLSAPQEIRDAD